MVSSYNFIMKAMGNHGKVSTRSRTRLEFLIQVEHLGSGQTLMRPDMKQRVLVRSQDKR